MLSTDFMTLLRKSGLMATAQLGVALALSREHEAADKLAAELVRQGLLTSWQASQLLKGQTGFVLQHYKLLEAIGKGGMGHVFKAIDSRDSSIVAVKVMSRKLSSNQNLVNRFRREIRASSRLNCPWIVRTIDAGRVGKIDFMVMEFVNGDQLDNILQKVSGTADTAGYNGIFFTQEIVRGNKLTLAQAAAMQEVRAAEADLRKARISLASDVRRNYYKVLIAQEQLRFSRAISRLSDEVYRAQIDLVAGGEAAPYEPLQLRVFAVQARNNVTASANTLNASWRQLAAAAGTPMMGRRIVAGNVENSTAALNYEQAAAMLQNHSDIAAAQARVNAAAGNLRLQEAIPTPNLNLYGALQHDDTTPLSNVSANIQVSAPVPVLNRNQGNIASAHADLIRTRQELVQTTNNLLSQLADNFSRYETSRVVSVSYRTDIVPDQVRVYRGIYDRFLVDGQSVDFAQVVVSQQTLAQVVDGYVLSLTNEWNALVDVAQLLQVSDLQTMDGAATPAVPDGNAAALPLPDAR